MQNPILWVVGAVVIVAAGVGAWMYMGPGTAAGPGAENIAPQTQQTGAQTASEPQSLKTLISYRGSQKCTFSSATATSQSSGTVYVSNGQMHGDFTSLSQGKTLQSHMIVKDNTSYVWGDAMPGGFKMSFDSMASGQSSGGEVDPNTPVDYSCGAWAADPSLFVPPTDIQFQDLTTLHAPTP
jgi:hypothetical protein